MPNDSPANGKPEALAGGKPSILTSAELPFWRWLLAPFRGHPLFASVSAVVFALALALRIVLVVHGHWAPASDSRDYHELATSLAQGRGYEQAYQGEQDAYHGITFRAYRMPGYPATLAILYSAFGWNPRAAMILNLVAEMLTLLGVAVLAWHLFGLAPSIVAQVLWTLRAFGVTDLLTEPVFTLLYTALALLLAHGAPRRSVRGALAFGLVAVAAVFYRPVALAMFPALGIVMLLRRTPLRRMALLGAVAAAPVAVGLGLWGLRNAAHFGRPVWITTQGGRLAAADYRIPFERIYRHMIAEGKDEVQIDRYLQKLVREKVREDRLLPVRVFWNRFSHFLILGRAHDERVLHFPLLFRYPDAPPWLYPLADRLYRAAYYPVYYGLVPLGLVLWAIRRRERCAEIVLPAVSLLVMHALAWHGDVRYAAPIFPLLAVLSGYPFLSRHLSASLARVRESVEELFRHRGNRPA